MKKVLHSYNVSHFQQFSSSFSQRTSDEQTFSGLWQKSWFTQLDGCAHIDVTFLKSELQVITSCNTTNHLSSAKSVKTAYRDSKGVKGAKDVKAVWTKFFGPHHLSAKKFKQVKLQHMWLRHQWDFFLFKYLEEVIHNTKPGIFLIEIITMMWSFHPTVLPVIGSEWVCHKKVERKMSSFL